jgi:hypothetical protein
MLAERPAKYIGAAHHQAPLSHRAGSKGGTQDAKDDRWTTG